MDFGLKQLGVWFKATGWASYIHTKTLCLTDTGRLISRQYMSHWPRKSFLILWPEAHEALTHFEDGTIMAHVNYWLGSVCVAAFGQVEGSEALVCHQVSFIENKWHHAWRGKDIIHRQGGTSFMDKEWHHSWTRSGISHGDNSDHYEGKEFWDNSSSPPEAPRAASNTAQETHWMRPGPSNPSLNGHHHIQSREHLKFKANPPKLSCTGIQCNSMINLSI